VVDIVVVLAVTALALALVVVGNFALAFVAFAGGVKVGQGKPGAPSVVRGPYLS
jgi:hypothetical protein